MLKKEVKKILQRYVCRVVTYDKEVDDQQLEWILCQHDKQVSASVQLLQVKAVILFQESKSDFKALHDWVQKFLKGHALVLRAKMSVTETPCSFGNKFPRVC